jgi:phage shock protein PspC (stress-responsive transcriptional regulator)
METDSNTTSTTVHDDRPELRRLREGKILGGVATGLSHYLDIDLSVVRIAFVVLGVMGGIAVPLYVAAWLLVPEEGEDTAIADDLLAHIRAS